MKGKNKYLPVCAAMYANYAAHGFGLIILTQTAAWLMEKFNTDMVGVSYLVSVMAIGKIVILAVSGVLSDKFGRKPFVFLGIASYIVFFLGIYFAKSYSIAVFFALFFAAKAIYPLTTPTMIGDFKACGGALLIATGCRIAKMQDFPVADMIPAMVLVMPLSALWTNYIAPLL